MTPVRIGTSGWHYKHWRGPFYPETFSASRMLEFYTKHFDTVELNNTFYRLPLESGLEQWRETTPPRFCFSAKGSRFITHMKKLKDPAVAIERYFEYFVERDFNAGREPEGYPNGSRPIHNFEYRTQPSRAVGRDPTTPTPPLNRPRS